MEITKEIFDDAYNKYLPSKFIKFAFRYFSKSTERKDFWLSNTITYFLIVLFVFGFFGTVFELSNNFIKIFGLSYSIILSTLVIYLFISVKLNNRRITKICKELGVDKWEYNNLVNKFYTN